MGVTSVEAYLSSSNGSTLLSSGQTLAFQQIRIPIAGWTSAPKLLALPTSKENVFSAMINDDGSVYSKSSDFIQSISQTASTITVVPKSGIFTVMPNIIASEDLSTAQQTMIRFDLNASSVNSWVFSATNSTNGAAGGVVRFSFFVQKQGADYTPAGVYVGSVAKEQIAYLKDVKTSGTNGGSCNSGYGTRTLNTSSGDTEILSSFSSNQFGLNSGTYLIKGCAPSVNTVYHKLSLYNVTDASYSIIGTSQLSNSGALGNSSCFSDKITLSAAKTFEARHYCSITQATATAWGAATSAGDSEVYTTIEITRLNGD
jgi:hypothetical protein